MEVCHPERDLEEAGATRRRRWGEPEPSERQGLESGAGLRTAVVPGGGLPEEEGPLGQTAPPPALAAELGLTNAVLGLLSGSQGASTALGSVLDLIRAFTGMEGVGLRLAHEAGLTYGASSGLPPEFLCHGESPVRAAPGKGDAEGAAAVLAAGASCVCERLIRGEISGQLPCCTAAGSFWTNSTSELLQSPLAPALGPGGLRHCHRFGYESVALIPLRSGERTVGLLQLNDRRPGRLSAALVDVLEKLAQAVGIAVAHQRADEALRFRNAVLSAQQETSVDGLLVVDGNGRIVLHNRRFAEMWGLSPETLTGSPDEVARRSVLGRLVDPEGFLRLVEETYRQQRASSSAEVLLRDGRVFERHSTPMLAEDGAYLGRLWSFRDITPRKRLEEAARLAAVGQLAAGVIHDVDNLLSSIRGWAHLVQSGHTDCQQEMLEVVMRATAQARTLTANLTAVAAGPSAAPGPSRLEHCLEAVLAVVKPQLLAAGVEVVRRYQYEGWPVAIGQADLARVLLNLTINAIHAMPHGGALTVATAYRRTDTGRREVAITVADSGVGIAPENVACVFEPFFSTRGAAGEERATARGLGLYIVDAVVAQLGGTITVQSEVGVGTTFELHFPLPEASEEAVTPLAPVDEPGAEWSGACARGAELRPRPGPRPRPPLRRGRGGRCPGRQPPGDRRWSGGGPAGHSPRRQPPGPHRPASSPRHGWAATSGGDLRR